MPKIEALKVGPAADRSSDMGPLVTAQHLAKVRGYIDAGEAEGAKIVVDGRTFKMDRQGYENGYYHRRLADRRRDARHDDLEGGDLRPGAVDRPRARATPTRST